jgi:hypothetical protein
VALRRGHDPAAEALREVFRELLVDEQPLRRIGALIAGTDIHYPPPGRNPNHHALTGTFPPDITLHTDDLRACSDTGLPACGDYEAVPDTRSA